MNQTHINHCIILMCKVIISVLFAEYNTIYIKYYNTSVRKKSTSFVVVVFLNTIVYLKITKNAFTHIDDIYINVLLFEYVIWCRHNERVFNKCKTCKRATRRKYHFEEKNIDFKATTNIMVNYHCTNPKQRCLKKNHISTYVYFLCFFLLPIIDISSFWCKRETEFLIKTISLDEINILCII